MSHIDFALDDILGCTLLFIGPVDSAENTLMLPPTSDGNMAMVKKAIPNPPIYWVMERQKSSPWGSTSTSSITVAPVVVNPDIVSKNASV